VADLTGYHTPALIRLWHAVIVLSREYSGYLGSVLDPVETDLVAELDARGEDHGGLG
jgi:hypothetical protein